MRLLDTETFELQYHVVPPKTYAILSHRWREKELVFEEYSQDECRQYLNEVSKTSAASHSYQKVRYLCDHAKKNNIPFAWIDTVCINKSSSAELAEAINSMFQWYHQATVCYAYLDDVETLNELHSSLWLTRGWTLQELLAPLFVEFYSKTWELLGSKATLATRLSRYTRINADVLRDREQIANCRVATKFSWAARRNTTRAEDQAYCLFGLFGVNMPLLYGECEQAFQRLQMEILRVCPDESILAWEQSDRDSNAYYQPSLGPGPQGFLNMHDVTWSSPVNRSITLVEHGYIKLDAKILVSKPGIKARFSSLLSPPSGALETCYHLVLMCRKLRQQETSATAFQIIPCTDSPSGAKDCFMFMRNPWGKSINATELSKAHHKSIRLQNSLDRFPPQHAPTLSGHGFYGSVSCCITCTKLIELAGYCVKALRHSNQEAITKIEKGRIISQSKDFDVHPFQTLAFLHSSKEDAFVIDFLQCNIANNICVKAYHAPLEEADLEVWLDRFNCTREQEYCSHTRLMEKKDTRLTLDLPRSRKSFSFELFQQFDGFRSMWHLDILHAVEGLTDWVVPEESFTDWIVTGEGEGQGAGGRDRRRGR